MRLNPHAPIFRPRNRSQLFSIYLPALLTARDASTTQDRHDLFVPAKCLKISSDSDSPTVSEQLYLLTTQVDQLRTTSKQALEQTKSLIQTFPLANIKQFSYFHAVQRQVAHFFVDLNIEKRQPLKLHAAIRHLEDELAQLRRQVNGPSPSSLPVPFTIDPPCSTTFQDKCVLNYAQISKPTLTITFKGAPSTSFEPWLPEQSRASPSTKPTPESLLSDLEPRIKKLEKEITTAKNCRETNISIYRSQFTFLYDRFRALESGVTDNILWKLTSLRLIFDTAKSTRLDDAAKDPSTHYDSPLFRTHSYGYKFFV